MAGQAASRAIPFGSDLEPQRCGVPSIEVEVEAPPACALNDPARLREQTAGFTAPEEIQP